ncbi:MAG: RNA polymerase sigma-70 factor [Chitinophagaceae bacterium]|nr:MAG: RNA polymerase sigma-70 factor [Chitinophagaceae bacterium]
MNGNEHRLIALLGQKDAATFEEVFKAHYRPLHAYACQLLKDSDLAEEAVQNVFFRLWDRSGSLNISGPVAAYLYRAVHNEALNQLKHQSVRTRHGLQVSHLAAGAASEPASARVQQKELAARLQEALIELPEQCRTIFQMSRFEELRYREIAERLGLSVKTVENQMGKALRILRSRLADLLGILLFILLKLLP